MLSSLFFSLWKRSNAVIILLLFNQLSFANTEQVQFITVLDDNQQTLKLTKPAKRIISLSPHLTENIFYLGEGKRLVARDSASDFPEKSQTIPSIGNSTNLSLETIVSLRPDLVLAWHSGNTQAELEKIVSMGIPVYYSEPRSLDAIIKNLKDLAALTGNQDFALKQVAYYENQLKQHRKNIHHKHKPPKIFYQAWHEPLMTLNGEHLISSMIKECGGSNIFAEEKILAPQINIEALIKANPDIIIAGNKNKEIKKFWEQWPMIAAVKNKQYLLMDPDYLIRPTPRVLKGFEAICDIVSKK